MRKVIVLEHISLDGVIQAPGGPEEDTSDGFAYGGWAAPYSDEVIGTALRKMMNMPFDLLVGRKTFEIWAAFWPQHGDNLSILSASADYRMNGPALSPPSNSWKHSYSDGERTLK